MNLSRLESLSISPGLRRGAAHFTQSQLYQYLSVFPLREMAFLSIQVIVTYEVVRFGRMFFACLFTDAKMAVDISNI